MELEVKYTLRYKGKEMSKTGFYNDNDFDINDYKLNLLHDIGSITTEDYNMLILIRDNKFMDDSNVSDIVKRLGMIDEYYILNEEEIDSFIDNEKVNIYKKNYENKFGIFTNKSLLNIETELCDLYNLHNDILNNEYEESSNESSNELSNSSYKIIFKRLNSESDSDSESLNSSNSSNSSNKFIFKRLDMDSDSDSDSESSLKKRRFDTP